MFSMDKNRTIDQKFNLIILSKVQRQQTHRRKNCFFSLRGSQNVEI